MTQPDRTAIDELRKQVDGPVVAADDPALAEEVSGFQLSVTHEPVVVVGATSAADVATAVRWAAGHGLPVAVQATGHSPGRPARGMLVTTTGRMRSVSVDPDRRVATAGAGARWSDVVEVTAEHGLVGLSGSSSGVGVVGYTLTGGVGPLLREFGFASDLVTRIQLVTADGAVREVTADSDAELFWALRGGRGNSASSPRSSSAWCRSRRWPAGRSTSPARTPRRCCGPTGPGRRRCRSGPPPRSR